MFRSFVSTIPVELEEAARIDGCGNLPYLLDDHISAYEANCGYNFNPECVDNLE